MTNYAHVATLPTLTLANHADILRSLELRAANGGGYKCNRGPRPSGALLFNSVVDRYSNIRHEQIYGDVEPTIGSPSCISVGCMVENGHCVRNIHAEVNALLKCASLGIPTHNGIMYSINKPCYHCTMACLHAGVSKIYYAYVVYDDTRTQDIIHNFGLLECVHVPIK